MKKIGRPKGDKNKDCICTIRMDENTLRRLEAYCIKFQIPKSCAIRKAINMLVNEENS